MRHTAACSTKDGKSTDSDGLSFVTVRGCFEATGYSNNYDLSKIDRCHADPSVCRVPEPVPPTPSVGLLNRDSHTSVIRGRRQTHFSGFLSPDIMRFFFRFFLRMVPVAFG